MKAQIITAAGLLLTLPAYSQSVISSGMGFGTFYYDVQQVEACGFSFAAQNTGPVECSLATALSLDAINSNYLVAMNHTQLVGDMSAFCGKRVVVSVNGVPSDLPLFIGDGCERCATGSSSSNVWNPAGAPGLDFSYSVLSELSSSACADGHIDITWQIVDDTLFNFDTTGSGAAQGPVSNPAPLTAPPPAAQPAPTTQALPPPPPPPIATTDAAVINPVVPTTLVTLTSTIVIPPTTTDSNPSGPCATGAWQCNGNVLEQCLAGAWSPRVTCAAGNVCQGGANPFCAPPNWQ